MRVFVLLLITTSASAQVPVEDVWLTFTPGLLTSEASESCDKVLTTGSVQAARGPWAARLAYAKSSAFNLELPRALALLACNPPRPGPGPSEYQTVALETGLHVRQGPTRAALLVGPALTWGQTLEDIAYRRVGLGASVEIDVQVIGPLWVGLEFNGVVNAGASHAGVGGGVRIDLLRAPR